MDLPDVRLPARLGARLYAFGAGAVSEIIVAIDAKYFYAGIIIEGGKVIDAAPIVRYMIGWSRAKAAAYVGRKRWKVTVINLDK